MELVCSVQKYDWGKRGDKSMVALIAAANRNEFILANIPYAELWMGVHPSGPCLVKKSKEPLSKYIEENAEQLGVPALEVFGPSLPFLFKVLSVESALSIQAHPAKAHAEELHSKYPNLYKDPNHKPELAIALTEFEALCGFKPVNDIVNAIKSSNELKELLGADKVADFVDGKVGIRVCFEALMTAPQGTVEKTIYKLIHRNEDSEELKLLKRLNRQFPGDVGVLCVYWLNYLKLAPGEALFLAPNEPHAYISGDCIECMANSDNVVRAGLTPKLRDVPTLCNMLTYKSYEPAEIKFQPIKEDDNTLLYKPPVKDFAVAKITVSQGKTYSLLQRKTASILLTTGGRSTGSSSLGDVQMKSGNILFIPAETKFTVNAESDLTMYQALCNV